MDHSFSPAKTDFVIFAIENTAKRLGVSGRKIYLALKNINGIQGFLYPSYPALHTQSKEYIVDEVIGFLKEHSSKITKERTIV